MKKAFSGLVAAGLVSMWYRMLRAWNRLRRRRKVDEEWQAIGFMEVRPGIYMQASLFSDKQLRQERERKNGVMRLSTIEAAERRAYGKPKG